MQATLHRFWDLPGEPPKGVYRAPPKEEKKRQHSDATVNACDDCMKDKLNGARALEKIKGTADSGCTFCQLVHDAVFMYSPDLSGDTSVRMRGYGQPTQVTWTEKDGTQISITVYGVPRDDLYERKKGEYRRELETELSEICFNTGSRQAVLKTRKFMQKCEEQGGPRCRVHSDWHLPTRVLDLGVPSGKGRGPKKIRLYEKEGSDEPGPYICLSHCWGIGNALLRTTKSTLAARKREIRPDELPKTFLDAVDFTRKLKIRYLWIDSLCIIQDDEGDWQKEAGQMHSIYQHSYLTLAATKSRGPHEGLFSVSSRWKYKLRQVPIRPESGINHRVSARYSIDHLGEKQACPLLDRGWVFQERLISSRVLHFGPQELTWECMCLYEPECECGNAGTWDRDDIFFKFWYAGLLGIGSGIPWQHMWYNIVENYTSLKLTFDKDIFPALSGVAEKMAVWRPRYLAGLWEDTLIEDLLWCLKVPSIAPASTGKIISVSRPEVWRAPTWSWASVKGRIAFYYDERTERDHKFTPHVLNFSAQLEHLSENKTGQLKSGRLTITSGSTTAILHHCDGEVVEQDDTKHQVAFEVGGHNLKVLEICLDYDIWASSNQYVKDGEEVTFLQIGTWKNPEKDYGEVYYLVLRSCEKEGVFERIGLLSISSLDDLPNLTTREVVII